MTSSLFDFSNYDYSLPRAILESYLVGNSFDYKKNYTSSELDSVKQDTQDIFAKMIANNPPKNRIAYVTAGAPGAGKSTLLEKIIEEKRVAYVDPDRISLRQMERTYTKEDLSTPESQLQAYTKWRPASNFIAQAALRELTKEGYDIAYGTTSSAPQTAIFFDYLNKKGYKIVLIHISAPDEERWKAIQERDKTFVQTTKEDVISKGELVPQRINDTYLKFAEQIDFYFRAHFDEEAKLGASWVKDEGLKEIDQEALEGIKAVQNLYAQKVKEKSGADDLFWEKVFP